MKATVFLGGGRITSALVAGLRLAGYSQPIVVHDRNLKKLQAIRRMYGVVVEADLRRAVESALLLIVAVRPESVRELLRQIAAFKLGRPLTAVSLAAGIPLPKLCFHLGLPVKWARAMPSPVSRSGRGLTALAFAQGFPVAGRKRVRDLFLLVGTVLEIPEKQFDAFTVTYSSSHGYHALSALIDAAEGIGLDRKTAQLAAAHALADGIAACRESGASLEELSHEAATPGGIAAAVMNAVDSCGYRKSIVCGLRAGMKQARKNATK
ncbi:MAG TPA: pyrroline-5-carboxylate reductase dimerization domain-containing protein [Candidatus Deferrimicrobiaceae bacterium]|nr:pyrroline-5-carboxylate reductase dimerization domain-containing protein [Candidatus Deferrimicrobiaceae bacterium]